MRNILEKRDPWGHGTAIWILAAMLFVAPFVLRAVKHIHLENDVEAWLPEDDPEGRIYTWYKDQFPSDDRILVTWEGSTIDDPRIGHLAADLLGAVDEDGVRRGGSPYVKKVVTPSDVVTRMTDRNIEQDEAVRRLESVLIGAGPLKVRLTDAGRKSRDKTVRQIVEAVRSRLNIEPQVIDPVETWNLSESDSAAPPLSIEIPSHDLQLTCPGLRPESITAMQVRRVLLEQKGFPTLDEPDGRRLVEDCFFAAGSPVAVAVTLSDAGNSELTNSVTAIREAALAAGVSEADLHLGGRPVALVELNRSMKRAAWNREAPVWKLPRRSVVLLSGLIGIALAMYFLRHLGLGALVVGLTFYATMAGVSLVPITGHSMNMVLVVMPTLLMVLALSCAIHVANYWKHASADDPQTAVQRALDMARQPCVMASLTTAVGLLTLCTSPLSPVRQFGGFSALGCLIGLGLVLYGLPAILQITRLRPPVVSASNERPWYSLGALITRRPWTASAVSCAILLAGACGLSRFQTETKVVRNFQPDSPLMQDYRFIEQNLTGITPIDLIVRFTPEAQHQHRFLERLEIVREIENKVRSHPSISGSMSLADFLPEREAPGENASRVSRITYNRRSNETERRIKDGEESGTASFLTVADEPTDWLEDGDAGLNGAGDELWRISAQADLLTDVNYGRLTAELDEAVQSVTRYHQGASHVVTGMAPLFDRTQRAIVRSLIWSFGLAFFVIAGVIFWTLRNPLATLVCMLPNVLPIGFVFGVVSFAGQRIDIGAMITASVALGIAVDGTLHLLTWFRHGIRSGRSRQRAVIEALAHCGPAMWQTSVAVGIGLLMLAPAELVLISRFGWLMSALIGAALFADLVLLPALLAGPLGALLERSIPARTVDEATAAKRPLPAPHVKFGPARREKVRSAS
ncbi:MAG: hypothetical protein DWQ34_26620 [Planctomycetota bacterium]|nr:MAG: hypothetical protein DWQ29_24810 [Planctomycetota bacterium]REJ86855.1 MAG: hypothetical protein DWQ34_26620 [Planctomycetota bacterium]